MCQQHAKILQWGATLGTHTYLSPPALRKLLENILVPLPSLLVDTDHLTPVARPHDLAEEKGTVMRLSRSAGWNQIHTAKL